MTVNATASVEELLRSIRGRLVLRDLCGQPADFPGAAQSLDRSLRSTLGDGLKVSYLDPDGSGRVVVEDRRSEILADPEQLTEWVLRSIQGLAWWSNRSSVPARGRADHLSSEAQALLDLPATRWWGEDIARDQQVILGFPDRPPDLDKLLNEQLSFLQRMHGRLPQALTTSRCLGEQVPAVELCSSESTYRWLPVVGFWAVRVAEWARVYELRDPEDWTELCARYPRRLPTSEDQERWGVAASTTIVPDWKAVSEDWDGVHVSMRGLLTAVGVPVRVDDAASVLEDVDTEVTAWFRRSVCVTHLVASRRVVSL